MKTCITCKEEKPESSFGNRTDRPSTRSYCKTCGLAYSCKSLQLKKERMISSSRFKQVHVGLSALAQKVYAAVPISEPWSASRIHSEMQRNGGSTKDLHIVMGCINSLIASGLVSEPERGTFIRSPVKDKPTEKQAPQPEPKKEPMTTTAKTTPKASTPIEMIAPIAGALRLEAIGMAQQAKRLEEWADSLETKALEIEENNAAGDADTAKLKQLQQLLKSLS